MNYLIVVVGPTAVGKTDLCIELAGEFETEIVSADSRQFFREMEIGTAKPALKELSKVKHHFINSHSIQDFFTAGSYEKEAIECINSLFEDHKFIILTGGSGLYIQAVTEGIDDMPAVDQGIRTDLNEKLKSEGLDVLANELRVLDPEYYKVVDQANPQRIIRALEIIKGTGEKYSTFRKSQTSKRPFEVIKIGLERDREELYERINLRMDQMIEEGLFEEAQSLIEYRQHNALQTVGYKEIYDYIDGVYDRDEAVRLLKRNSRRYAKRQMTWFRRDDGIKWFHPGDKTKIVEYVKWRTLNNEI